LTIGRAGNERLLLNSRNDSDYWRACRNETTISDSLAILLEEWIHSGEFEKALMIQARSKVYSSNLGIVF
jgi:hypothetical protein